MADDPIKQRLDSIYNLLNGKIVKLDEKESIIAGNASSTLKAILDALKILAADNDTAKIVNALQKTERAILDADGNFKKLSNLANIDEKKLSRIVGVGILPISALVLTMALLIDTLSTFFIFLFVLFTLLDTVLMIVAANKYSRKR